MRAIAAAHAADLLTFSLAVAILGVPVQQELNPTMVAAYAAAGLAGVMAWKVLLAGTILLLVGRIRTRRRAPGVLLGYALGLVGAASNVVAALALR